MLITKINGRMNRKTFKDLRETWKICSNVTAIRKQIIKHLSEKLTPAARISPTCIIHTLYLHFPPPRKLIVIPINNPWACQSRSTLVIPRRRSCAPAPLCKRAASFPSSLDAVSQYSGGIKGVGRSPLRRADDKKDSEIKRDERWMIGFLRGDARAGISEGLFGQKWDRRAGELDLEWSCV